MILRCYVCGKNKPSYALLNGKYCSSKCKTKGINNPRSCPPIRVVDIGAVKSEFLCPHCRTFLKNPHKIAAHKAGHCSKPRKGKKEKKIIGRLTKRNIPYKRIPLCDTAAFYESREWRELRYQIIKKYGRKCQACYAVNVRIHVDHIKPISLFPELKLDQDNLQILCADCNLGKSNKDCTDWRPKLEERKAADSLVGENQRLCVS